MTDTRTDALRQVLLGMLAPLLRGDFITDTELAGLAAQQAIDTYQARTQGELVTITQIVAFALTALDTLRLSMATDLSLSMKLRLRGNANALNRASINATRMLDQSRQAADLTTDDWIDTPEPPVPTPPADPPPAPEPQTRHPVPPTPPVQDQTRGQWTDAWADAMATVAAELQGRAAQVPPRQRKSNQLWMQVLNDVAADLRRPGGAPVGLCKADLFRTTLLAGGGLPAHLITPAHLKTPAHLMTQAPARRTGK